MNINDFLNSSSEANGDMENMDDSLNLNYDNSELMSSEFFDSVFSLENDLEEGFFSTCDEDINLSSDTSSHMDFSVFSPQSSYSESDKNSVTVENADETGSVLSSMDSFEDPILISILEPEPTPDVQIPIQNVPAVKPKVSRKQPTKIVIQNPTNKKFIAKPIITASQFKKTSTTKNKPQILKVQQVSNNGRPVLLPLSVKSIKILNSSADIAALTGHFKRRKIEPAQTATSSEDEQTNIVSSSTNQYLPLSLTAEEKRLLTKEGIQLPSHHPLTKNEERELKRIRRKIRNKISAQDSRKRKKEYVDGLEERVKRGSDENKNLLQRVKELQKQNKSLVAHVSKLQSLICNSTTSKATPSTCLMVVLLSALLVSLPNLKLWENKQISTEQEQVAVRRSLLSSPQTAEEDGLNMEEFLVFKDEDGDAEIDIDNSTDREISKILEAMEKKYDGYFPDKNKDNAKIGMFMRLMDTVKSYLLDAKPEFLEKNEGFHNKNGFIEPDIDDSSFVDEGPPFKRSRYRMDEYQANDNDDISVINENNKVVVTTVNGNNIGINSKDK